MNSIIDNVKKCKTLSFLFVFYKIFDTLQLETGDKMNSTNLDKEHIIQSGELYRINGLLKSIENSITNNSIKTKTNEHAILLKNVILYLKERTQNINIEPNTGEIYRVNSLLENLKEAIKIEAIFPTTDETKILLNLIVNYLEDRKNNLNNKQTHSLK